MADRKILKAAIDKMAGESKKEEKEIPAHEVKCPKCGHEWTMGEEEYEEEEHDNDEEESS